MPDDLATTEFLKTSTTPRPLGAGRRAAGNPLHDVDDAADAEEDVELEVDEEEDEIFGDEPNEVVEEVDMSLDAVEMPKRTRKPKAAAGPQAKAKAKGKAKAGEDLVVVPATATLADFEKQKTRNGFRVMYAGKCVGVQSHWGCGFQHVSMKCNMHHKCRVAFGILRVTDDDLLVRWLMMGSLCTDSQAHTSKPLPDLSSSSSSA